MKAKAEAEQDEMRPEYDFDYSTAVRGKYYRRLLKEGANVVVLDADIAKAFRTGKVCKIARSEYGQRPENDMSDADKTPQRSR